MRSADFNRHASKVRVLQEIRPTPKKINWDRIIYLLFLFSIVLAAAFMLARKNLVIKGEGQVLFKKLDIQMARDIQLVQFVYHEGDSVQVGDTLFWFYDEDMLSRAEIPKGYSEIQKVSNDNLAWIVRERLSTLKRIELANLEMSEADKLVRMTETEMKRIEQQVYLDIYPASRLDPYHQRMIQLQNQMNTAREEIRFQREYLTYLENQEQLEKSLINHNNLLNSRGPDQPVKQPYISPVRGTITQVFKEDHEVSLEAEIIMTIHKPTNLYIKAYYDQKDIPHLTEGDVVEVHFPDGSSSFGILQRFYLATYKLPEELQKKYEPTTRNIAADIIPVDEVEVEKWKTFYKMNVRVTKSLLTTS